MCNLSDIARRWFAAIVCILGASGLAGAQQYTVSSLPNLPANFTPNAINNNGLIVGLVSNGLDSAATSYSIIAHTSQTLGKLGGTSSVAYGVNDNGQIVGAATNAAGVYQPVLYSGGAAINIGAAGGAAGGFALGINAAGQIVGSYTPAASTATHAFLYNGGPLIDLGTLGGTSSDAQFINASGQISGNSMTAGDAGFHAFIYANGHMTDLTTFGGTTSEAYGMNGAGQVVGFSDEAGTPLVRNAFLYSGGVLHDLGNLLPASITGPGATHSRAVGIDDSARAIGFTYIKNPNGTNTAVSIGFVEENGVMLDLNTLIPQNSGLLIDDALVVNGIGQIVVDTHELSDPETHDYMLLTPVPEPMCFAGVIVAAALFRRRMASLS